ncbi:uncharacterized protein DNG_10000 [Cephalotrichum gorgonifer]|uniref:Endoplasmic reticulum junction formation protein lunapark n=1 Tax=Cephalotrichum gorgonifer TaxID=2041049 RepID=A0AAE8SZT6_9PEZI|nr:uncharacterized protein DNG_10000 [Cephalotrichum gorgonifer]
MVSFWPWRRDDSSTASFEKTLSTLSAKIADTQARLDAIRSRSRRVKVLWTLYLSFAYLVYAIVVVLIQGSHQMGVYEWAAVGGGPVLIYVARTTLTAYYNYRIESLSSRLKEQHVEREKTIKKLKEATRYDSTLELIEKYGGAEGRPRSRGDDDQGGGEGGDVRGRGPRHSMGGSSPNPGAPRRTNLPPPPTANIQRRPLTPEPGLPQPGPEAMRPHHQDPSSPAVIPVTEEFAPNAYGHTPPPPSQQAARLDAAADPHWYDRVLDLLLGEDETAAKNRIVLICHQCRLVNGQAPPGTKALSEVGTWKCMSCGAVNGEMDEGKRIVREVLGARGKSSRRPAPSAGGRADSDPEVEFEEEAGGYQDDVEPEVVGGTTEEDEGGVSGVRRRKGKK